MTAPVRLGAVPLLCVRPMTFGIERGEVDGFDLAWADADACAERLAAGAVDLALLPTTHYARLEPDLRLLPGIAVTVCGAMLPALAAEHGPAPLSGTVDEWRARTGLPFVSWVWVGRSDASGRLGAEALARSLQIGVSHLSELAHDHVRRHGGNQGEYQDFVTKRVSYRLGAQELSGLAALVEHVRAAHGMPKRALVRLFDFAFAQAAPAPVVWPRPKSAAAIPSLDSLLANAAAGQRLSTDQGLRLYEEAPLLDLGRAADQRRQGLHPGKLVTYIIDRNVNYTNLCVTACKFCNFYRPVGKVPAASPGSDVYSSKKSDGYTLSRTQLAQKFEETVSLGGTQVLLQGGVNPNLRLTYYEDLFRWIKASFPLALHALSPEEVSFIANLEGLSIREVLERLVAAGLDSLPGGGAEILDDEIRHRISPLKCGTETWLFVMREAHAVGLRTTSTMVFGFGENPGHIARHLERLRALQDQTSGFTAFICWPFQAEGTRLKLSDDTTAHRYLRIFALARLYLDNVPNLQVSWPTMGPAIGQVALRFGGNDFGSAMIEENVVSQAGAAFKLSAADIERRVIAAGFVPRRRNMRYELLAKSTAGGVEMAVRHPAAA